MFMMTSWVDVARLRAVDSTALAPHDSPEYPDAVAPLATTVFTAHGTLAYRRRT
jgi:hypothetical protein